MLNLLRSARLASRCLVHAPTPSASLPTFSPSTFRLASSATAPAPSPLSAPTGTKPASPAGASAPRAAKHKKNKSKAAQAAALASAVPRPPASASTAALSPATSTSTPTAAFASAFGKEQNLATFANLLEFNLRSGASKAGVPADGQAIALTTAESFDTSALLKTLEHLGLLRGDPETGLGAGESGLPG